MVETASTPSAESVPLRARVPSPLLEAVDALARQESRPGAKTTRSAALRLLLLEALSARGVEVQT